MKKLLLFCIILAMTINIFACNNSGTDKDIETTEVIETTEQIIETANQTEEPTAEETEEASESTPEPTALPTEEPTTEPTAEVTAEPTADATKQATATAKSTAKATTKATATPTAKQEEEEVRTISNFKEEDLTWQLQNVFTGDYVNRETVFVLDYGITKELLYYADEIISVRNYSGKKVYEEGKDYQLIDGKLYIPEGSSIPCITTEKYYSNPGNDWLKTLKDGEMVTTYWGEGTAMTNYQINVEYKHSDSWTGYKQTCYKSVYETLYKKMEAGEDVTILFYGDSCTYGAASSFTYNYFPRQYSYALLVTDALADIFGYTVKYINTQSELSNTGRVPEEDYVAGTRGTITYVNTSVGGWTTADGISNFDKHAKAYIEKYGCDLFVLDLGGNDGAISPQTTADNDKQIIALAKAAAPDTCFVVMSTLLNRPDSNWAGNDAKQEPYLKTMTESLRKSGTNVALCGITSMTASVLEHKDFEDISGNNINHPNDYWGRLYAMTLFETLVGYENLK